MREKIESKKKERKNRDKKEIGGNWLQCFQTGGVKEYGEEEVEEEEAEAEEVEEEGKTKAQEED